MNEKPRCLTLVGTASIQDYLFRSNRLKENLGGSYLVAKAIKDFAERFAKEYGGNLVYCGGGNAAVIFSAANTKGAADTAKKAVYDWSKELLQDAPGLRVVVGHAEFKDGDLHKAYKQAMQALFLNENAPPFGAPLGALPVVRTCASTGLAADEEYRDPTTKLLTWLSGEAHRKRTNAVKARTDFETTYETALEILDSAEQFAETPLDFDNLGQQDGAAQIAVVHIDGNGIGTLLSDLIKEGTSDDDIFKKRLSKLSKAITQLAREAFKQTLVDLSTLLDEKPKDLEKLGVYLKGKYYPVRPIVDGGDDLTFVCQGKLGIPLAIRYLECFEKKSEEIVGQPLTACAGVAIVHQGFPFAHAYQLVEELTSSAKLRRKLRGAQGSWIDFEVVREGTLGSLDKLRQDLRGVLSSDAQNRKKYSLLCRPYRVGASFNSVYDWSSFEKLWRAFGGTESKSGWPRSLAKQLHEMLAQDPVPPKSFFTEAEKRGHTLPDSEKLRNGWDEGSGEKRLILPLYDPLDLIDQYVNIDWANVSDEQKGAR